MALIYQRSFGVKQFDLLGLLGGGVVSSVSHHFLPSSILQGNARWPPDENLESLSQWRELTTKFHVKHAMITGQHKVKRSYWKVMGIGEMSFYDDNNRLESSLSSLKLSKKERGQRWVRFYDCSYRQRRKVVTFILMKISLKPPHLLWSIFRDRKTTDRKIWPVLLPGQNGN